MLVGVAVGSYILHLAYFHMSGVLLPWEMEMPEPSGRTTRIQSFLERLLQGDTSARQELHEYTYRRFLLLTKTILRGDPVYEKGFTSDVWHIAWEKVEKDLDNNLTKWKNETLPAARNQLARRFIGRVGSMIRWSVVDIARRRHGAKGKLLRTGIDFDAAYVPADFSTQLDFQEQIELLPDDEREIVNHLYYGVPVVELAELYGTYPMAVRRKLKKACKRLAKALKDYAPES